jgi:hypothetical protein
MSRIATGQRNAPGRGQRMAEDDTEETADTLAVQPSKGGDKPKTANPKRTLEPLVRYRLTINEHPSAFFRSTDWPRGQAH